MTDVKPYFVPPLGSIRPSAWQRHVDGEWEDVADYVDEWDQRTRLVLRCALDVDLERVRAGAHLMDGAPLVWSIGWRATDTGLVGEPAIFPFDESNVELRLIVPPERAGATIVLTRRLILRRNRLAASSSEARYAGSILWSDETPLRLAGRGAAFPTEIIDFSLLSRDHASWFLELPPSVDAPAMGSMILMINSADTELVSAVSKSRRHSELQKALIDTMEEGVVEELVRWAIAHWDQLDAAEPGSVGEAAHSLTVRVLPDPSAWTSQEADSMALKAAIISGARSLGFGRSLQ
jgi:hypothetical protein